MEELYGIIIYQILENGNLLSGVYTNSVLGRINPERFPIDSEIASKRPNSGEGLVGLYDCRYIVFLQTQVIVETLEIEQSGEAYFCRWTANNGVAFEGIGMRVGASHLAVSYTNLQSLMRRD